MGAISDEQVIIKHIALDGLSDGFVIRRLENVYRIDVDGRYEHKIHRLYSLQNQRHEAFLEIMEDNHSNLFKEALLASKKHELIVKLYIDETEEQEDIIGFVKAVDDNEAIISRISDDGSYDGESVLYLNDIIKLDCGRRGEIIRQLLHREEDK
ncbi:hypothetical protein SDC9_139000 [bioreactor metagenome]|uniref:Ribosome maturation factor RimP n=1 Tax=bioreactor metagenome TaxID=1076179 RepID=A0A645DRD0_9ZZZZ